MKTGFVQHRFHCPSFGRNENLVIKMIEAYKKENEDFKKQLWSLAYQEMFDDLAGCF
jgi:putative IMPACT (imprinted ancient) family translation regulator